MHFIVSYLSTFSNYCKTILRIIKVLCFILHWCWLQFAWCWLQATLRCWLLGFSLDPIVVWLFYWNSVVVLHQFWYQSRLPVHTTHRKQPFESKTIKRESQPNMTVPFKFLPHEILNKPKPAPVVRIYPLWPHEFFIPKPTEKPVAPSKPVTSIHACLWSQNP